jgi:anti-anti-sigma factor
MTDYTIQRNDNQCLVILDGNLTAPIVSGLQSQLKDHLDSGARDVSFDLAKTEMIDSRGIGLLIATNNSLATRKGTMQVLNVSGEILQLMQNMRLISRLNVKGR